MKVNNHNKTVLFLVLYSAIFGNVKVFNDLNLQQRNCLALVCFPCFLILVFGELIYEVITKFCYNIEREKTQSENRTK